MTSPICRVCNSNILENEVKCANCDTVHHEECFQYGGKCSIFACGCQKYEKNNQIFLEDGTYLEDKLYLPAKKEITDLIIKKESLPATQTELVLAQYEDLCKHFPPHTVDRTIVYKASKELVVINPSEKQLIKHEKKLETIVNFFVNKTKMKKDDYNVLDRLLEDEYTDNLGIVKQLYRSCISEYVWWKNKLDNDEKQLLYPYVDDTFQTDMKVLGGVLMGGLSSVGIAFLISMIDEKLAKDIFVYLLPLNIIIGIIKVYSQEETSPKKIDMSNEKEMEEIKQKRDWYPKEINSKYAKLLCAFTDNNNDNNNDNLLGEYNGP